MFKKVLIAEDHQSTNFSVRKILEELAVENCDYVYHCDAALLQMKNAFERNDPYELLITDLYFEEDDSPQRLAGGDALIEAVRAFQPGIKVIVFSAESKVSVVNRLMKVLGVNGYVRKARRDVEELRNALQSVYQNKKYLSADLSQVIRNQNTYEFSAYDITLLTLLSNGMPQKNIPHYLEENNISPSGLSSVEKKLNAMRNALGFSKNEQLIALCKDLGII